LLLFLFPIGHFSSTNNANANVGRILVWGFSGRTRPIFSSSEWRRRWEPHTPDRLHPHLFTSASSSLWFLFLLRETYGTRTTTRDTNTQTSVFMCVMWDKMCLTEQLYPDLVQSAVEMTGLGQLWLFLSSFCREQRKNTTSTVSVTPPTWMVWLKTISHGFLTSCPVFYQDFVQLWGVFTWDSTVAEALLVMIRIPSAKSPPPVPTSVTSYIISFCPHTRRQIVIWACALQDFTDWSPVIGYL